MNNSESAAGRTPGQGLDRSTLKTPLTPIFSVFLSRDKYKTPNSEIGKFYNELTVYPWLHFQCSSFVNLCESLRTFETDQTAFLSRPARLVITNILHIRTFRAWP